MIATLEAALHMGRARAGVYVLLLVPPAAGM